MSLKMKVVETVAVSAEPDVLCEQQRLSRLLNGHGVGKVHHLTIQ